MAWIESHQALEKHPKVFDLMFLMGWDLDTAIGKLHRFWWWCVDYAEDGDLRKYSPEVIGRAMGLEGEKAAQIVSIMVKAKWIDENPYLRVHDWWDYIGLFLQRKYGEKKKDKWQHIQRLYSNYTTAVQEGVQQLTQPNQPNLTLPNLNTLAPAFGEGNLKERGAEKKQNVREQFFEEFWKIHPARNGKKVGKAEAKEYFLSTKIKDEEVSLILQAARNYAVSKAVTDGFAKDAIRFLRKDFWRDWVEPESKQKGDNRERYSFLRGDGLSGGDI